MGLLKLVPHKGWIKIKDFQGLFVAKIVQTLDEKAYVIGGAKDNKSIQTLGDTLCLSVSPQGKMIEKKCASMITPRSSFGCTVNAHKNHIIVAGGYEHATLIKKCEYYDIARDQWHQMPSMNEEKCSPSLCVLDGKFLYCFGGLAKHQSGAYLLSTIELLNLDMIYNQQSSAATKWMTLSIKLPQQACDVGVVPLNNKEIMVYGGWNKTALTSAFLINKKDNGDAVWGRPPTHELRYIPNGLDKPDFFLMTGVAMKLDEE